MKYDKHFPVNTQTNPSVSRPSFREAIRRAEQQIEIEAIDDKYSDQAREICYIIAEVYMMNPTFPIRISGEMLDGYLVQQVFNEIRHEHVELVISNFNQNTRLVKNTKAYLRTSLYNSVFEFESHYQNLVNHDITNKGIL